MALGDYAPTVGFDVAPQVAFADYPTIGATKAHYAFNEPLQITWNKTFDFYNHELALDVQIDKSSGTFVNPLYNGVNLQGGIVTVGALPPGTYKARARWNPASVVAAQTPPAL